MKEKKKDEQEPLTRKKNPVTKPAATGKIPEPPPKRQKLALPRYTNQMKDDLLKEKQLTDLHIDLAQQLIKKQFPWIDGLQSCLLQQNDGFQSVEEGIQIHYNGDNHWVVSSSLGGDVSLYDSNYHGDLVPSLTHQLARMYRGYVQLEDEDGEGMAELCISIPQVQQQLGGYDCGLFAVAFALHIAMNDIPEQMVFEQTVMRQHLHSCFRKKKLEPFPHKKVDMVPKQHSYLPFYQLELFCSCLMPETYDDMVACDDCEEWYHLKCIGMKVKMWTLHCMKLCTLLLKFIACRLLQEKMNSGFVQSVQHLKIEHYFLHTCTL